MTVQRLAQVSGNESARLSTGAYIVLVCFVFCQFVDITLATVGGFVISAQKIASLVLIPLGAAMMRNIRFPGALVVFGVSAVVAFCVGPALGGQDSSAVLSSVSALSLNFVAAVVVYSALRESTHPIETVGRIWVVAATITAVVAVGQFFGAIPLVNVSGDALGRREAVAGLQRATGFKFDPNFAALMLVIGLVFVRFMKRSTLQRISTALILAGTFATLSRMGVLLAIVVLVATAGNEVWVKGARSRRLAAQTGAAIGVGAVAAGVYALSSGALRGYLDERTADLRDGFNEIVLGRTVDSGTVGSAVERAELFSGTTAVVRENFITGVGPQNLQSILYNSIGVNKGAHNTYLETLAIGGLFGLLAIVVYVLSIRRALGDASAMAQSSRDHDEVRRVRLVVLATAAMAFVLTLDYNAFIWVPLILSVAIGAAARESSARMLRNSGRPRDKQSGIRNG